MLWTLAVFLLANILVGLLRVVRGPTASDRMVAALLFGTTGVAFVLVLAEALGSAAVRDVALVFAVLAALVPVVFARIGWSEDAGGGGS